MIREADKGSVVVIMDNELYIKEGYGQLGDPRCMDVLL